MSAEMTDEIEFQVNLPSLASANDVVQRQLTVVAGGSVTVREVEPDVVVVSGLYALQGAAVRLELRDVDDAGNGSDPSVYEFVATDVIAPPRPGDLTVVVVGEAHVEPPVDP